MKRKDIIHIIVVIMTIAVVCASVGIVKYRKDKKAAAEKNAIAKNNDYIEPLHIKGKFSYEGNKIYVEDIEYDVNQLMVDVAYVNYRNENEQFTIELLYEEYDAFLNGGEKEKYKNLNEYVKYIGNYTSRGNNYKAYCDSIDDELGLIREVKQRNGENVSTRVYIQSATTEEIQEAINRVNQRGDLE